MLNYFYDIFLVTNYLHRIQALLEQIFSLYAFLFPAAVWGLLGEAKVSCILRHRGVQLRLAYSLARPTNRAAGKDRGGGCFLFSSVSSLSFIFLFSPLSLFFISSTISFIYLLAFLRRKCVLMYLLHKYV